jgi:hypothetical protein
MLRPSFSALSVVQAGRRAYNRPELIAKLFESSSIGFAANDIGAEADWIGKCSGRGPVPI